VGAGLNNMFPLEKIMGIDFQENMNQLDALLAELKRMNEALKRTNDNFNEQRTN
jgi:hypothetical protein